MSRRNLIAPACLVAAGLAVVFGSMAVIAVAADPAKEGKPAADKTAADKTAADKTAADKTAADKSAAAAPEMKLPPGWTEADIKACVEAGTPGKMHEHLAKGVGVWKGKNTMWMGPGADPVTSDCTSTVTPMMDGRYFKLEMAGDMPGMGPYTGFGLCGFDNVSKKFVATWVDNQSTGIMTGAGELTPDGKTMTFNYTFNCPINNKPAAMREVETVTGPNTKTLEMYGADPKSGKEYKMMKIEFTKQP